MKLRAPLASLALLLAVGCSRGCGEPGESEATRGLKPLPAAPALQISPEALPEGPLAVVASRPQGEVRGEVRPTVTFSRPVKTLAMLEPEGGKPPPQEKPLAQIQPPLEGEWRWLGSSSVEFVPQAQVPYSTHFTVTVFKGLRAIDGSELKEDHVFSFTTPKLELQEVSPPRGFAWVNPNDPIKLLFNQPVRDVDLLDGARLTVEGEAKPRRLKVEKRVSIAEERRAEEEGAQKKGQAERRHYPRPSFEEKGFKNQQTRYELSVEGGLPKDRRFFLTLSPQLHGEQGAVPMGGEVSLEWKTYGPLRLLSVGLCAPYGQQLTYRCPQGPILVSASNPLQLESLKGRLKISPPVELSWNQAAVVTGGPDTPPWVSLPGKFKAGTNYQVSVAPGVTDEFGQSETRQLSVSVRTDDLPPTLRTGGPMAFVEASSGGKLPIEVANLHSLKIREWKLTPAEMTLAISDQQNPPGKPAIQRAPDFSETQTLSYPPNELQLHPLPLERVLGSSNRGLALVELESPDLERASPMLKGGERRPPRADRIFVQVSDLAAHVKVGPTRSAVWVTRLSTGTGVGGAQVTFFSPKGEQVWSGQTDASGVADVPGVSQLLPNDQRQWGAPTLGVSAEKEGDLTFTSTSWNSGIEPYEFGVMSGWEGNRPESVGFAFTDRGIYRPGDKVYFKGVARYRKLGQLKIPSQLPVHYKLTDSRGNKVLEGELTLSKFGTFEGSLELPKDLPLGSTQLSAEYKVEGENQWVGTDFRTEEYRAPQFRVDVETSPPHLLLGETLKSQTHARYLFGGAMAKSKVRWSAQREPMDFESAEAPDFRFNQETWWEEEYRPQPESTFFASGEGQTDVKGDFATEVGTVEAPGARPYLYTVESEVEDVNRQRVAGRSTAKVHPAGYYVGLRAPSGFAQVGQEVKLDTQVVNTEGKISPGQKSEVEVVLRSWKSIRKKDATGGFTTLSEPSEEKKASCSLTSAKTPVTCSFKAEAPGLYIARARLSDAKGRKHESSLGLYVAGPGWVPWQRNDNERVELQADKSSYQVGEVAKVLVKSPYPQAHALLTVEREGVLERRPLELKGSAVTVEIPITESMVPNVYAGILIVRPRVADGGVESGEDPGRPAARVGILKLEVEKKIKRLSVAVKTDRAEYQPRQEVTASVQVTDAQGKAAPCEITVFAVDEAVLRLTGYQTPDPIGLLYPTRPLSVWTAEPLLNLVRKRAMAKKGEDAGGGGGGPEGKDLRSNFQTTVLFQTAETDAQGRAQLKFKLPDNLTEFRVMAVATSLDNRFGSGHSAFKVNKPVLALPALPRFARVGDTFEAGAVVHVYRGELGEVTVTAQAQGARLTGPAERKVKAGPHRPQEVRFPFVADAPGVATLRFRVQKGADSDAVEQKIPIELPVAMEAVATSGDTTDTRTEGLSLPTGIRPGLGGLEISLASTSLGNFQQGFGQLIDYPYGCLEQQSSRLVPLVALRELAGQFGVPWAKAKQNLWAELFPDPVGPLAKARAAEDPDQVVKATVDSIFKLQQPDGSFTYWPSAGCSSSWNSAWATLALGRAKQVGYPVKAEEFQRAQAFLEKVAAGTCAPCEQVCPEETQVMAAYALARTGRPKASNYGRLFDARSKLPLFSQALLADAMFVGGGERPKAKALLQEILNHAKESPRGMHFEEVHQATYATLFHSDTRTTGAVLQTLTDITPDSPLVGKMAHYLTSVRRGNGEWRSTQEAAFSLMALTEVVRTKEKEKPQFTAEVKLGAKELLKETFSGRSMEVTVKNLPWEQLGSTTGSLPLVFSKKGTGVLYYSTVMRYAPEKLPTQPKEQGLFVQRWFEPYSGGGQSTQFLAGDLVRVRVRVASNQNRHWVAFEIPLPAGLETVDTSLATTASLKRSAQEEGAGEGYQYESEEDPSGGSAEGKRPPNRWAYEFYSPFSHVEVRDSKVVLFADDLPPGIHVHSFVARATTPGKFLLKPASGAGMYEPEVFGRSEGGTFEVALPRGK